ncbi:hypothetical protein FLGE108171_15230 [Flavobacterium gelidilacus]|uniref:hypothetical protein n=1 Tax=Flavobacterium gelidilacus TaxID=206041 RepID=UPI00041EFB56|nr:hypothetical protein [Flavobacterium gelidilacus]
MTKTRIVGGKITETTGGDYNIYTKESIVYSAATTITETGVEKGVSYGDPETYTPAKIESEIEVKILKDTFLPLGILNFKGEIENKTIKFEISCKKGKAENLLFSIKHNQTTVYNKEIDVVLNAGEKTILEWDGFSNSKIYDSKFFTDGELIAEVTGADNEAFDTFKSKYDLVKWIDIKIDNNTKTIDVALRVDIKDGGAKGINDADKVSAKAVAFYSKTPYEDQNISYEELENMALEGINTYWSRTKSNNAKIKNGGVSINGNVYEVCIQSYPDQDGMPAPEITYWTNTRLNFLQERFGANRSRNWFLSRKLFYIEGYYHEDGYSQLTDDWFYIDSIYAMKNFIETAAHELGHEILKEYIGFGKSITHKGSSSITQNPNGNYSYPIEGEIDIMKYTEITETKPYDFYDRVIADENDVLGLLWCSKLNIK